MIEVVPYVVGAGVSSSLLRVTADTSGAAISLDMQSRADVQFISSDNIAASATISMANDSNAFYWSWRFNLTAPGIVLTFPADFYMSDALWNDATKEWTNIDAGDYEAQASYDGTSWVLRIFGPLD